MEKFVQRLKTDMKLAMRTVKSAWKTYFALFAAVFLIQMLFGVIGFARENSLGSERETILTQYDSHVELTHLNNSDYYYLLQSHGAKLDPYFDVIPYSSEKNYFTVGILFKGDPEAGLTAFCTEFASMFDENGTLYTKTPLYHFDTAGAGDTVRHGVLLTFVGTVSFALLTILSSIRINHYKFTYGIYMSFGVDFKRLVYSTLCETMLIFLLTYLPAMVFAFITVAILSLAAGGSVYFSLWPMLWAFVVPCIATILATVVPVRYLTTRRPSQVMLAEDNSNRVISPRRSRMIFATRFPRIPEFLSLFRFSGYGMKLVLSGTLFSILFTCGIYAVSYYDSTLDLPFPQYTVTMSIPDDEFVSEMEALEGVSVWDGEKVGASECYSNLLVDKDKVKDSDGFLPYPASDDLMVTHKVVYRCADAALPEALISHYNYKVDGDPKRVLTDENSIILSDSVGGRRVLDVKPGDTVYLAVDGAQSLRYNPDLLYADDGVLRVHLANYTFTYRAFTVAAVIRNEPDRDGMCIYLPSSVYTELTNRDDDVWSVYIDHGMDDKAFERTDKALRSLVTDQIGAHLQNHETRELRALNRSHNYTAVYTMVFFLVLSLVPLMWLFTLALFNEKRKVEMDVYRALGATGKELRRLFFIDGCVLATFGMIVYAALAPICTSYLQRVLTSNIFFTLFLPSYADKPVYLSVYPHWSVYLVGILLTALSAISAAYLSYKLYQKRESEHISENFSQEE